MYLEIYEGPIQVHTDWSKFVKKSFAYLQLTGSENATESEREPMLNDSPPPAPTPALPPPSYSPNTIQEDSSSGNLTTVSFSALQVHCIITLPVLSFSKWRLRFDCCHLVATDKM